MKKQVLTILTFLFYLPCQATVSYPFPSETFFAEKESVPPIYLPQAALSDSKKQALRNAIIEKAMSLEGKLSTKIFGQEEAVRETSNAIMRFAAGVHDPSTPIACLLYCGPSGVGKTELAKQLCLELYNNPLHFFRINMSEFSEAHTVSRLIGSPPGYVGYDQGGALSNRLKDNPFLVVLLDEVEKAHPKVLKLFMHVFDAGYFTSSQGEEIDCRNAIFILTSNIAACEIADLHQRGLDSHEILQIIQSRLMDELSPELYNRLDCMVFSPLSEEIFEKLICKLLNELKIRVSKSKKIELVFDQSLIDYLKTYTLDPKLGARPLKRIIDKELATTLAKAILDQNCKANDTLLCSYSRGHLLLEVIKPKK